MRRLLRLAVLLAGCGGDPDGGAGGHSAPEVIAAFDASGLAVGSLFDDGCGPSEAEQEELGITVFDCSRGELSVGSGPRPSELLVPTPPGPATFSVLVYSTAEDAENAVGGKSRYELLTGETVVLLRRANVVVMHEEEGAPRAAIVEALDRLTRPRDRR